MAKQAQREWTVSQQTPEQALAELAQAVTKESRRLFWLRAVAYVFLVSVVLFTSISEFQSGYARHGFLWVVAKSVFSLFQIFLFSALLVPHSSKKMQGHFREALSRLRETSRESLEAILLLMQANHEPSPSPLLQTNKRGELAWEFGRQTRELVASWLARTPADELERLSPAGRKALLVLAERFLAASKRGDLKDPTHTPFVTAALLALATLRLGTFTKYADHPEEQVAAAVREHTSATESSQPRA